MHLTILGTRGSIKPSSPNHTRHAGMMVDDSLLFDIGEKEYINHNPSAIFLTHLHSDHAYFVDQTDTFNPGIPIFSPEPHPRCPDIHILYTETFIGEYRIIPIPTVHCARIQSQAYAVVHQNKRIVYTGDLITIPDQHRIHLNKADLIITEASYIQQGGRVQHSPRGKSVSGHAGIPDLLSMFKHYTDTVVLTHFGSWFFNNMDRNKELIKRIAAQEGIRVIIAEDGMVIPL